MSDKITKKKLIVRLLITKREEKKVKKGSKHMSQRKADRKT